MRKNCLLAILCFLAAGTLTYADDLTAIVHSCGQPSRDITSDYPDIKVRWISYKPSNGNLVNILVTSKSKGGSWKYDHAYSWGHADKLPCLAALAFHVEVVDSKAEADQSYKTAQSKDKSSAFAGKDLYVILWILAGIAGLFIYFLPLFVAMARGCKSTLGIFVVDLFLGWSLIGWVVALAWAVSGEKQLKPSIGVQFQSRS